MGKNTYHNFNHYQPFSFPYTLECAVWEFTLKCNLNCLHCGSTAGEGRREELNEEEALNLCEDLKKAGCLSVALMGGEPFLRKDFWQVAKRIRELGMELSVITNGTVFTESTFSSLKELSPRAVSVSLDAASPEIHDKIRGRKGAFKKTTLFMEKALEKGLPLSVITTLHKLNIKELPALRDMLKGRKIAWQIQTAGAEGGRFSKELLLEEDEFYSVGMFIESSRRNYSAKELPVIGAHDIGYNSALLRNTSLFKKWPGCQAGISVLGIRSNGDILGCLAINDDRFVEGNARKIKIKDLWNSPSAFKYTRQFKKEDAGENCLKCPHVMECKGGCNEVSLMKTGKMHNDPQCFFRIEKNMFGTDLKRPLGKWRFKMLALRSLLLKPDYKKLTKIFTGHR